MKILNNVRSNRDIVIYLKASTLGHVVAYKQLTLKYKVNNAPSFAANLPDVQIKVDPGEELQEPKFTYTSPPATDAEGN